MLRQPPLSMKENNKHLRYSDLKLVVNVLVTGLGSFLGKNVCQTAVSASYYIPLQ